MKKIVITLAMALLLAGGASGCASNATAPDGAASESGTEKSRVLPDEVNIPDGATVVDGPQVTPPKGGVTGWTALAKTTPETLRGTATEESLQKLTAVGYTVTARANNATSDTYTVHKGPVNSEKGTWIQVTVTNPLNTVGPVIAYRAATAV